MDEQKPLTYFTPGKPDAALEAHDKDRRMTFLVLVLGGAMVVAVFTLPEFVSMLEASRGASASPPAPALMTPAPSTLPKPPKPPPGGAKIRMALEAYRQERGLYPDTLNELRPRYLDTRPDATMWRYIPIDEGTNYELRYIGGPPNPR
jgi:hypothetical protein